MHMTSTSFRVQHGAITYSASLLYAPTTLQLSNLENIASTAAFVLGSFQPTCGYFIDHSTVAGHLHISPLRPSL